MTPQTAHSHLHILDEILTSHRIQSVLEFGMGDGSTGLFLDRCSIVISVEMQNLSWHEKLIKRWGHRTNWTPVLSIGPTVSQLPPGPFDLVFVDGHGDSRPEQIMAAMTVTNLIAVHDTQEPGYMWHRIKDNLPAGWTWTDDKRDPTWTSILERIK